MTEKYIALSPIYKIYPDLEEIEPKSVQLEEDEELYYKSLFEITKKNKRNKESNKIVIHLLLVYPLFGSSAH